jgi:hypothetical protein
MNDLASEHKKRINIWEINELNLSCANALQLSTRKAEKVMVTFNGPI